MIAIVAAVAKNGCLGIDNHLPWDWPEDKKFFRELTAEKNILMGRKTFESILQLLKSPLPNRNNIMLTRNIYYPSMAGVKIFHRLDQVMKKYQNEDLYIIGGGEIYAQTINLADKMYLTQINQEYDGDTFFPMIDNQLWQEIKKENHTGFSLGEYVKK